MVKDLIGMVAALGVLSAAAAFVAVGRSGVLVASPPPALAATAEARCPDFTLEDDGVCLPMVRPPGGPGVLVGLRPWVAPDAQLSAFVASWKDAPVAPSQRGALPGGAAVVFVRTRVESLVTCHLPWSDAQVSHVDTTQEGAPVLRISGKTQEGADAELTVWGLTATTPGLRAGAPCAQDSPLGTSGDVLVFASTSPHANDKARHLAPLLEALVQ